MTSHLQLFIDLGSSLTKTIYRDNQGKPALLLVPPEIATVTTARIKEFMTLNAATATPQSTAWMQFPNESSVVAIGKLAETFKGEAAISQRKIQPGMYRILGTIGIVKQMLGLPSSFSCDLGIALPVTEYIDRNRLSNDLLKMNRFSFRGEDLTVAFNVIQAEVEGAGLVREHRADVVRQGKAAQAKKIVAIMMGHRNLSVLTFAGTIDINESRSDGPGFFNAVEVAAKALALEPHTAGLLEAVAGQQDKLRVQGSLKPMDIRTAVREGRTAYWQMVSAYLEQRLPGGDYDLVCGGGACWAMQSELRAFFKENQHKASSLENLLNRMAATLKSKPWLEDTDLKPLRLMQIADPFIGFCALLGKAAEKAKAMQITNPQVEEAKVDAASKGISR